MMSQLASHLSGLEGERAKLRAQVIIFDIFVCPNGFLKGILILISSLNRIYDIKVVKTKNYKLNLHTVKFHLTGLFGKF